MSPGWQVICYGVGFAAFVVAAVVSATRRRWWPTLVAIGLAAVTLVSLWNANAVYD